MTKDQPDWFIKPTKATKAALKQDTSDKLIKKKTPSKWIVPSAQTGVASTFWLHKFVEADNAEVLAPSDPPKGLAAQLVGIVTQLISEQPLEREGRKWAAQQKCWYCDQLGVSERQLQRIVKKAPLISRVKVVNGERLVLMRLGPQSDRTAEDYARVMAHEWRDRVSSGKNVKREEFGLLVGFAKDLGEIAPDVFITVLENWSAFMAGVKNAIALAQVGGDFYEPDPSKFVSRYYEFPSISVIRRFWRVAYELFDMLPKMGVDGSSPS